MGNQVFVTKKGLKKLKEDLKYLKTTRRREVAEAIQVAKEQGDLSENAEYAEAKEEQSRLEEKIAQLEATINNAKVIENNNKKADSVQVGSTVVLKMNGQEVKYFIVGSSEANPTEGRISNESPLGKLIIGKKEGEEAVLETPSGKITYRIVKVE